MSAEFLQSIIDSLDDLRNALDPIYDDDDVRLWINLGNVIDELEDRIEKLRW